MGFQIHRNDLPLVSPEIGRLFATILGECFLKPNRQYLTAWNGQADWREMQVRKWITMNQLVEEIGESRSTIDKWRRRGVAPPVHKMPNGKLRFDLDEVYAWLDDLTVSS